ncbi:MAG: sigma-70 family RNA polymerase sigma factor [Armatimonadetes bacterium]|nr:MAG: sigma-70 family RNA polymerase sigma factor [Armatimonadota bacterium]
MAIAERDSAFEPGRELIHRLAAGDESAARELYVSHCDALFRFVRRRCSLSIEDAEEIVNDTFLAALELASGFELRCSVMTWLCSLARNRIVDHLRKVGAAKRIPDGEFVRIDDASRKALREVHDPNVSVEHIVERLDRVRLVQALLNSMTADQREAVTMRYVEEFSVPEIARIMNRTPNAVERLLERAKIGPRREMLKWLGNESFRALCFDLLSL